MPKENLADRETTTRSSQSAEKSRDVLEANLVSVTGRGWNRTEHGCGGLLVFRKYDFPSIQSVRREDCI